MPGKNEYRKPEERIMSYGKHAGKQYGNVPTPYLEWVVQSAFKGQTRKQGNEAARVRWAKDELSRRARMEADHIDLLIDEEKLKR